MKRLFLLAISGTLLLSFPVLLSAQHLEAGLLFGAAGYHGDLSTTPEKFTYGKPNASLGLFVRYDINPFLTGRANFSFGQISANDADAKEQSQVERNLEFRSKILEMAAVAEINLLGFSPQNGRRFSPYLFGGLAFFNFRPEATYDGGYVSLQPLGTEGQGMPGRPAPYKLAQIALPMGVGFKLALSEKFNIGLEFGARKTFTDYLDDVSTSYVNFFDLRRSNGGVAAALGNRTGEYFNTDPVITETGTPRGNPEKDDWYFISGLSVSYSFYGRNNGLSNRRGQSGMGCPSF